ncbi:uncharacterized protein DUF3584 [Dyadobacter jejuensis]|uniref:Uncharacterized protein DUF3584 n=1 Tax=Dyadobacter jejuensis TaxID=1082580 RepID=A0A316AFC9_9BACT|nr:ATP-binding protein [Dyadobacter jejuensis]PWJ55968.1 uncharacterized protein DUF3584 [Dyadobacter jejuensis]
MRFLNKIIFINSASVAYAEINLDGNVHFIGTQGVGKSTALRAILFFYNADKLKLGIEKGKRSFDDYYFPYGNSYLVYELSRETGPYCVVAFKSQGRVAYRFINGPYNKNNFIGTENKALGWEQVRGTFNGPASYTRKIERYEEYRDILYGNNKGLPAEFRKYALIESRQYQNLPRTIQNVFLNSKLEAEFIKQTIIMSLNEEDVKIDLDQYAFHLRDFEQQLADISKWSDKNRSGDVVVRSVAKSIAKVYTEISFLDKEKVTVARQLLATHAALEKSLPEALKKLEKEKEKLTSASKKVAEASQKFQEKKAKIVKEINLLDGKITEARQKLDGYTRLNIGDIIARVSKRSELENKKEHLKKEEHLLSARFAEITTKYDALIVQNQNQLNDFINQKNREKINQKDNFYKIKEEIQQVYERIIHETEDENREIKINAEEAIQKKIAVIHDLNLKKKEIELKRWFEKEIDENRQAIDQANQIILSSDIQKKGGKAQVESLQKQWDLDIAKYDTEYNHKTALTKGSMASLTEKIEKINSLIAQRKDSLYEWLHENKPGWEQTIGRVINQEQVLFHSGLSPRLAKAEGTFYGVEINLEEIAVEVKTVTDYEKECLQIGIEIKKAQALLAAMAEERVKEQEKLKKKYQPQIKASKNAIDLQEYAYQKALLDLEKATIALEEFQRKGVTDRSNALEAINQELLLANEEKQTALDHLSMINNQVRSLIERKKKERDHKIAEESAQLHASLSGLDKDIEKETVAIQNRNVEIKAQENRVLEREGADTKRISIIVSELLEVNAELRFIEDNRNIVSDYYKDKRELFDLVDEFKANKKLGVTRLLTLEQRYELGKEKLVQEVDRLNTLIHEMDSTLRETQEDLEEFNRFVQTEVFLRLNPDDLPINDGHKVDRRLKTLIAELNDKSFSIRNKTDELRAAIGRFLSYFSSSNIFGFKTNLIENEDYFLFAENLKEFIEEDKIAEYEKRTNEHFASLIAQIGKETTELVSKEAIIQKVIADINKDFEERNFAGVIKSINLRLSSSANRVVMLLSEIRLFNNEYSTTLGASNLFSTADSEQNNKKAVGYLKNFANEIASSKQTEVNLSDTFELQFKIVENDNDSGWVEKLTNFGSEGTDILVKAMINIMLLNVFKESASKRFKDFRLHCMMDEIGKLHPTNVKGILKFANDRNILLINSSPTSYNASEYRHTYKLSKDSNNITKVVKLLTNH